MLIQNKKNQNQPKTPHPGILNRLIRLNVTVLLLSYVSLNFSYALGETAWNWKRSRDLHEMQSTTVWVSSKYICKILFLLNVHLYEATYI